MTTLRQALNNSVAALALVGMVAAPLSANAQLDSAIRHRQKTKNDWRNLAYISGAVGMIGLLTHKDTLTFLGLAGALYSADRYERDRKSQSKMARARAAVVRRGSFNYNGHRYVKRTVWNKGKKYYKFVRAK